MKKNYTKKQHFIAQSILELFFGQKSFYEILISNGNVIPTTVADAMEINYFYELHELSKNTIEDYFANNFDDALKNTIEQIIENIDNPNEVCNILKENMQLLVTGYYKSFAYATENTNDLLEKKDENAIRKMLNNIFDREYINSLCKTIIYGYDFCIIKSDGKFFMCDQYIVIASLNVKNQFVDSSNRAIGFKDTIILIPITSSYYIVFKNGNKLKNLKTNAINVLDEEELQQVNNVIYRNSYLKVAGNNDKTLLDTYNKCAQYNLDRVQCFGADFFYNNKKEVFFYDVDYEIFDMYRTLEFGKYVQLKRNDKCLCGSGKKYKRCCFEKVRTCQEMYKMLEIKDRNPFRIDDCLIVERNI